MKIGFIADFLYKNPTGIAYYSYGIIEALRRYYPNFEYYYFIPKNSKLEFPGFRVRKNEKFICPINLPFISKKNFLWYSLLPLFIKKYKLDYIVNFTTTPHFFHFFQKEILVVHDLSLISFPQYHRWQSRLLNKLFFKKNLESASLVLVNSKTTRKDLLNYYPQVKKKTFSLFIPYFNFFKLKIREKKVNISKPYILNINTIEPRKNIVSLIEAFEELKYEDKIPHKLIIVGKLGWNFDKIIKRIENSIFKKEIYLTGYISEAEKTYLIKNSDFVIYPSYYEGIGLPVFEAVYYKKPIIASNIPSIKEFFKDSLVYFNPHDTSDLKDKIKKIINLSKTQKEKIIDNSNIIVKNLVDEKAIKKKIKNFILFCKLNEKF